MKVESTVRYVFDDGIAFEFRELSAMEKAQLAVRTAADEAILAELRGKALAPYSKVAPTLARLQISGMPESLGAIADEILRIAPEAEELLNLVAEMLEVQRRVYREMLGKTLVRVEGCTSGGVPVAPAQFADLAPWALLADAVIAMQEVLNGRVVELDRWVGSDLKG